MYLLNTYHMTSGEREDTGDSKLWCLVDLFRMNGACDRLKNDHLKDILIPIPETCDTLYGKRGGPLQRWLEILSWDKEIILNYPSEPKCNHECPLKREAGRDLTHTGNRDVKTEQRGTWRCWPWRQEWCSHQKWEEARNSFSLRASGGSMPLPTPWFQLSHADLRLLTYRAVRKSISIVLSHQVCGDLLQQP